MTAPAWLDAILDAAKVLGGAGLGAYLRGIRRQRVAETVADSRVAVAEQETARELVPQLLGRIAALETRCDEMAREIAGLKSALGSAHLEKAALSDDLLRSRESEALQRTRADALEARLALSESRRREIEAQLALTVSGAD